MRGGTGAELGWEWADVGSEWSWDGARVRPAWGSDGPDWGCGGTGMGLRGVPAERVTPPRPPLESGIPSENRFDTDSRGGRGFCLTFGGLIEYFLCEIIEYCVVIDDFE